jgi:transcriptional regulator with XRE-family HTH domain
MAKLKNALVNDVPYTDNGTFVRSDGSVWLKTVTLGEIIKRRRLSLGIQQRHLAGLLRSDDGGYCSPQTLNNIEHGYRAGSAYWKSLSDNLDIPYSVFIYYGTMKDYGFPMLAMPYATVESAMDQVMRVINSYVTRKYQEARV